jgi:hypothetical protein
MRTLLFYFIAIQAITGCADRSPANQDSFEKPHDHSQHSMNMEVVGYSDSVNSGLIAEDTMKGSPVRTAMNTLHGTHVHIEYGSPGVKGRIIWGGVVPYNMVWVTGAHQATHINFYKEVIIADQKIPKGRYAIFTIPGETEWTVIINRNYKQHLTDAYDAKEDLVRVKVKPEVHPFTARLTYGVEELADNNSVINILWEKIKIGLPFKTI